MNWERFEFGESPKWDSRFKSDLIVAQSGHHQSLNDLYSKEATRDAEFRENLNSRHQVWERIDPDLVQRATNVLLEYVNPERIERIRNVLNQRTGRTRFLFESECARAVVPKYVVVVCTSFIVDFPFRPCQSEQRLGMFANN